MARNIYSNLRFLQVPEHDSCSHLFEGVCHIWSSEHLGFFLLLKLYIMFVVHQEGHIKVYDGLKTIRRKNQLVICHQQCAWQWEQILYRERQQHLSPGFCSIWPFLTVKGLKDGLGMPSWPETKTVYLTSWCSKSNTSSLATRCWYDSINS